MLAVEVGGFGDWLRDSPMRNDRLWARHLEQVSPLEIQLFYARAGLQCQAHHAREAIDTLQSELLVEAVKGRVSWAAMRLINHEVPAGRYTTENFIDKLLVLSLPRRMAVVTALVTESEPERVVKMEWHECKNMRQVPGLAQEVLLVRAKVRHIRLPYVFWEWASEQVAAPLLGLREQVEQVFGEPWPAIQQQWTNMIWIESRSDAASLLSILEEVKSGRL